MLKFLHLNSSPCKGRLPGGLSGGAICVCAPPRPNHQAAAVHPLIRRADKWASGPILTYAYDFGKPLASSKVSSVEKPNRMKPETDQISCKPIQPTALIFPAPQTEVFLPMPHIRHRFVCLLSGGFSRFDAQSVRHIPIPTPSSSKT